MSKSRKERRKHPRFDLSCPIRIEGDAGNALHRTRALNVSDGGVFVAVPIDALPPFGSELNVQFSVPRTTPNTYMLEEFSSRAKVVRHQPMKDSRQAGLAMRFAEPLELMLEV